MKPAPSKPPLAPQPTHDLLLLHPVFRLALHEVVLELESGLIPIRVFETFRSPVRQAYLRAQDRSHSLPWSSFHQYGLAADFGLFIDGSFAWPTSGQYDPFWERLREIGDFYGLDAVGKGHLQLGGVEMKELQDGIFLSGGDPTWWDNLESHIESWKGQPPAPSLAPKQITPTPNPYPGMARNPVTD